MNGRDQVKAYAKLVNSSQRAPASAAWPDQLAGFRVGDRVRIGDRPDVLVVESFEDPVVRLRHRSGATLRAGWRAIKKVSK